MNQQRYNRRMKVIVFDTITTREYYLEDQGDGTDSPFALTPMQYKCTALVRNDVKCSHTFSLTPFIYPYT